MTEQKTSIIGSVTRVSFKIVQASGLAVAGVSLMMAGAASAYLTSMKIKEFYFDQHDPENMQNFSGYKDIPGFEKSCEWACKNAYSKIGWPPENTSFCNSMGHKPFSQQEGMFAPAALVTSLGLSAIMYLGSLFCFLGGVSLVGKSIETFTSIL